MGNSNPNGSQFQTQQTRKQRQKKRKLVEVRWFYTNYESGIVMTLLATWLDLEGIKNVPSLEKLTKAEKEELKSRGHIEWSRVYRKYVPGGTEDYDVFTIKDSEDVADYVIICLICGGSTLEAIKIYPPDDDWEYDTLKYILKMFHRLCKILW